LRELQTILGGVDRARTNEFVRDVAGAPRVFVYGLGRSGLVARMFGMRLVHLGRDATIVGDTTTPAIREDDLLVVCSRTGLSPILHHAVDLAHAERAKVAAVIGPGAGTLAEAADLVVVLPLDAANGGGESAPEQPMGSLFEQALHLYLDFVVLDLMRTLRKTSADMERVHSNLP